MTEFEADVLQGEVTDTNRNRPPTQMIVGIMFILIISLTLLSSYAFGQSMPQHMWNIMLVTSLFLGIVCIVMIIHGASVWDEGIWPAFKWVLGMCLWIAWKTFLLLVAAVYCFCVLLPIVLYLEYLQFFSKKKKYLKWHHRLEKISFSQRENDDGFGPVAFSQDMFQTFVTNPTDIQWKAAIVKDENQKKGSMDLARLQKELNDEYGSLFTNKTFPLMQVLDQELVQNPDPSDIEYSIFFNGMKKAIQNVVTDTGAGGYFYVCHVLNGAQKKVWKSCSTIDLSVEVSLDELRSILGKYQEHIQSQLPYSSVAFGKTVLSETPSQAALAKSIPSESTSSSTEPDPLDEPLPEPEALPDLDQESEPTLSPELQNLRDKMINAQLSYPGAIEDFLEGDEKILKPFHAFYESLDQKERDVVFACFDECAKHEEYSVDQSEKAKKELQEYVQYVAAIHERIRRFNATYSSYYSTHFSRTPIRSGMKAFYKLIGDANKASNHRSVHEAKHDSRLSIEEMKALSATWDQYKSETQKVNFMKAAFSSIKEEIAIGNLVTDTDHAIDQISDIVSGIEWINGGDGGAHALKKGFAGALQKDRVEFIQWIMSINAKGLSQAQKSQIYAAIPHVAADQSKDEVDAFIKNFKPALEKNDISAFIGKEPEMAEVNNSSGWSGVKLVGCSVFLTLMGVVLLGSLGLYYFEATLKGIFFQGGTPASTTPSQQLTEDKVAVLEERIKKVWKDYQAVDKLTSAADFENRRRDLASAAILANDFKKSNKNVQDILKARKVLNWTMENQKWLPELREAAKNVEALTKAPVKITAQQVLDANKGLDRLIANYEKAKAVAEASKYVDDVKSALLAAKEVNRASGKVNDVNAAKGNAKDILEASKHIGNITASQPDAKSIIDAARVMNGLKLVVADAEKIIKAHEVAAKVQAAGNDALQINRAANVLNDVKDAKVKQYALLIIRASKESKHISNKNLLESAKDVVAAAPLLKQLDHKKLDRIMKLVGQLIVADTVRESRMLRCELKKLREAYQQLSKKFAERK